MLLILAEYFNALCIPNHLLNEVLGVAGASDASSRMYSFETLFVHHQVLTAVDKQPHSHLSRYESFLHPQRGCRPSFCSLAVAPRLLFLSF